MHIQALLEDSPLVGALLNQWSELFSIDHQKQRVLIEMHNTALLKIAIRHKDAIRNALFKKLGITYRIEFYTLEPLRQLKTLSDYYEEN
jgi:hypothetical protein